MLIYDSVKKQKLQFKPIKDGEVSLYVCGPTVYDDAHLGHARSSLSFDLLARTLRLLGYEVKYAKNFTDIDDKIIKKVKETGKNIEEITTHYIERYLAEMKALNVNRSDIEPKATESMDAIVSMIEQLIQKGFAYRVKSGDVYFDTSRDDLYGSISQRVSDESQTQSRVEHTEEKRSSRDFALWKACADGDEICFDTPWSRGRPGWHIECSAMIDKYFDGTDEYSIDIHGGGADLLFPHHENEATQSRCCSGHELAKYWMHNGFVQIDGEKMSKSLGNSFFLKDALNIYDGEVLRYYLISIHYRNDFSFNEEDLTTAKKRLDKLYRLKKRVFPSKASTTSKEFERELLGAMSDDLNISVALSVIDDMIAKTNEKLDLNAKDKAVKREVMANFELVDALLGFGAKDPFAYFQIGVAPQLKEQIERLIAERSEAKKAKDFVTSDAIREELGTMGITIMDSPDGTLWEKI